MPGDHNHHPDERVDRARAELRERERELESQSRRATPSAPASPAAAAPSCQGEAGGRGWHRCPICGDYLNLNCRAGLCERPGEAAAIAELREQERRR